MAGEGWWMGFESIDQPSQSPEVERNPKMSILFFWLERAGGWGSSPYTHFKLKLGGGVHQPEPKCHFDLYPTISFLGGGYISQKQNVTLTCVQLFHSRGGGVHRPETKFHFNLYPTFSFWGGGGTLPANLR